MDLKMGVSYSSETLVLTYVLVQRKIYLQDYHLDNTSWKGLITLSVKQIKVLYSDQRC